MKNQVSRFEGARHDANAREMGYNLLQRQVISPRMFALFGAILIVLLLVFAAKAHADNTDVTEPVDSSHYGPLFKTLPVSEYVFDAAWGADMLTTLDIQRHPMIHETNAMLGTHPSTGAVVGYFAAGAVLHAAITYELVSNDVPTPIVRAWEYVTIGYEVGMVANNFHIGLRFAL